MDDELWNKWKTAKSRDRQVDIKDIKASLSDSLRRNIIRYYLDSSLEYSEVNKLLNELIQTLESINIVNYDDNLETQMEYIDIEINETIEILLTNHLIDILEIYLYEMFDYSLIEPEKEDGDKKLTSIDGDMVTKIYTHVEQIDEFCEAILEGVGATTPQVQTATTPRKSETTQEGRVSTPPVLEIAQPMGVDTSLQEALTPQVQTATTPQVQTATTPQVQTATTPQVGDEVSSDEEKDTPNTQVGDDYSLFEDTPQAMYDQEEDVVAPQAGDETSSDEERGVANAQVVGVGTTQKRKDEDTNQQAPNKRHALERNVTIAGSVS